METIGVYSLFYNGSSFTIEIVHDTTAGQFGFVVKDEEGQLTHEGAGLPSEAEARRKAENAVTWDQ